MTSLKCSAGYKITLCYCGKNLLGEGRRGGEKEGGEGETKERRRVGVHLHSYNLNACSRVSVNMAVSFA